MNLSEFKVPKGFRGKNKLVVQLWWLVQSTLFSYSPQVLYCWRRFLLRLFGAKIGKGVIIRASSKFTYPWKVSIGDFSWVGDDVELYSLGEITIGSNSVISQGSYLCTGSHDYNSANFDIFSNEISIGDNVWVASRVFLHPGTVISNNVIIDACSVCKGSYESGFIYSGFYASKIKSLKVSSISVET